MFYTEIKVSNPAINPKEIENIYDINWKIYRNGEYKPNASGEVLRYKSWRSNSNMYKFGYQPSIDSSTGEATYDDSGLRYPDLAPYKAGTNYLGRTTETEGSFVYVVNQAADHYTLHNFGTGVDKVKSPLDINEVAIQYTMADDSYEKDPNQPNQNTLQFNGIPHSTFLDDNWKSSTPMIARTVDAPYNTARVYECIETHIGSQKLLGYEVELIIREGGSDYKVGEELVVTNRFISQTIKVLSVDEKGAITDFEVIGVQESGADIKDISGHKFKANRNIDNTLGDSTAYVEYGTTFPAGHEFDDNKDEVIFGGGASFNYDCTPYYEDDVNAFYDTEEFNRWRYVRDIVVYLPEDIVIAEGIVGSNTKPTLNKYKCTSECVGLAQWKDTEDNFEIVSVLNGSEAPYDLQWVKANDLITDGKALSQGSTYYLNNTADTSYQYLVSTTDPNTMEVVPIGATATAFSQVRLELDGDLYLKIPFGHYLTINVEEIS